MTSPCTPGIYESKWRMSTATGNYFGEQIWVIISVEVAGTMAITQQMSKLDELGMSCEHFSLNLDILFQEQDRKPTTRLTPSEQGALNRWSENVINSCMYSLETLIVIIT